jgi:nucleoside 2-deoxyribosyltransferase
MKIYLAGPINGCTDEEANGWRSQVKKIHPDVLDPMSRDYRGKEAENFRDIVEGDKRDIYQSDGVLVYFEKPSVGTSMEVLYAYERRKPVVVVNVSGKPISPWLAYHATITTSLATGVAKLESIAS